MSIVIMAKSSLFRHFQTFLVAKMSIVMMAKSSNSGDLAIVTVF